MLCLLALLLLVPLFSFACLPYGPVYYYPDYPHYYYVTDHRCTHACGHAPQTGTAPAPVVKADEKK